MEERLQKVIARYGIASRRTAEQMMRDGRVSVNGMKITQPGMKVDASRDKIRVDGGLISGDAVTRVYLILNKPKGYVVTLKDPQNRPIVTDLLKDVPERIFPVGRLDYDSEGFLLMTNDGDFSHIIQHPVFKVPKTYMVKVRGNLTNSDVDAIRKGAMLEDGTFNPISVTMEKSNRKSCWLELTILEGRNRIIRRFFDSIDHPVARLIRTSIGYIGLGELETGEYRYMHKKEVKNLIELSGSRDKKKLI